MAMVEARRRMNGWCAISETVKTTLLFLATEQKGGPKEVAAARDCQEPVVWPHACH